MKPLTIADASIIVLGLQDEIRRSEESRYDHRLHGVLLVAQGMTCPEVGRLLGDAPRTVEYWVRRFEEKGLAGLVEGERSGRPRRLSDKQLEEINSALRQTPKSVGITSVLWDGKGLAAFIKKRYGVTLGVRQCQYIFKSLGFRRRKPRPLIARADPEIQESYKKTQKAYGRSKNRSVVDR
jgi:transposase